MIFKPNDKDICKHIDHYWVVRDEAHIVFEQQRLKAYPGITPDIILVLEGHFSYTYLGHNYTIKESQVFSFLHSSVTIDLSCLKSFVIIKFKPRGLSSILPFVNATSIQLLQNPMFKAEDIFGVRDLMLVKHLSKLTNVEIISELDSLFCKIYNRDREGFVLDITEDASQSYKVKEILSATNYSYSTLERHFKRDTGLTPKKFQSLFRAKKAAQEICNTQNTDWLHYVDAYGFFDQSHFCKEIKRLTSFSPSQLINVPSFITYRP